MEPWVPNTHSFIPRNASRPARVMTKAGTPNRKWMNEYSRPIKIAAATLASTAMNTGYSIFTKTLANIAADNPLIDPTERSILPTKSTQTIPSAIVPTPALCISRFDRLVGDKTAEFKDTNMVQLTASPTTTGKTPSSPPGTRGPLGWNSPRPHVASAGSTG